MKKNLLKSSIVAGMLAFGMSVSAQVYIETDMTAQFSALTDWHNWTGATGFVGWAAPKVKTNAGQEVALCERYDGNCSATGDVFYQTVKGLTKGTYKIELYGGAAFTFGRGFSSTAFTNDQGDTNNEYAEGDHIDENTGVKLYAVSSEGEYGGEIPIYYATNFNGSGPATVTLSGVEVGSDGELKIGMSKTSTSTNWHIIQLKGVTAQVNAKELYATIVSEAKEYLEKDLPAGVKAKLNAAIVDDTDFTTAAQYETAISNLNAAIESAKAYILAKDALPAMKELVESTNFYTEEALYEYYVKWADKAENGELTLSEASSLQNPNVLTGWHDPITCDNFLLSVWDTNPDFNEAPYYINTWSVEGDNDGTGFHVPFFEYWTADANVLAARTLTGTLENIPEGIYDVKAWVRVRTSDGKGDPTGITMQVGDGDPINVSAGQQVGTSQFYLNEFVAQGKVAEDGVLKVKFIVAEDNTISWLSFKNVWYELNDVATAIQTVNSDAKHSDAIFNLNGQQVEKAVKGLYIMNGKKVLVK